MSSSITLSRLQAMKQRDEKITMLTAYDASFARAACDAGVEILLVGDSLGMILQGHDSTLAVTLEDMLYHTAAVKRGNRQAMIMADLPFMSYATLEQCYQSCAQLMQAGAHIVKLEGADWLAEPISRLHERGVPVCAHLGLTPQSVHLLGGYKVQGREESQAAKLRQDALLLEKAGAAMLLLECVPQTLARDIAKSVSIPVIGIGAGVDVDGQVLVLYDMLGLSLSGHTPRFVKNFLAGRDSLEAALAAYVAEVKSATFPGPEHGFSA